VTGKRISDRQQAANPDYRVEADVMELTGDLQTKAFLQVQWTIWEVKEARALAQGRSTYSEAVRGQNYHGLVEAYSAMVGQLSRDIAERGGL